MIRLLLLTTFLGSASFLSAQDPKYAFSHTFIPDSLSCVSCHNVGENTNALEYYYATQGILEQLPRYQFVPGTEYSPVQAESIHLGKDTLRIDGFLIKPLVDPILKSHLRLSEEAGVIVGLDFVNPKEVSDALELTNGDVLLSINGKAITHPSDLRTAADENPTAVWSVERIRAGERKETRLSASLFKSPPKEYRLGVVVEPVSEALITQLGIAGGGLLVTEVIEDSAASEAGVQMYDILVELADVQLSEMEDVRHANRASEGKEVPISVIRKGKLINFVVRPKEAVPVASASQPLTCPAFPKR